MTPSLCHYTYIPMPCTDFSSYFFIYLFEYYLFQRLSTHTQTRFLPGFNLFYYSYPIPLLSKSYIHEYHARYIFLLHVPNIPIFDWDVWNLGKKKYISLHLLFALVCIFRMDLFFFSLADGHAHIIWVIRTFYGCKYNI